MFSGPRMAGAWIRLVPDWLRWASSLWLSLLTQEGVLWVTF